MRTAATANANIITYNSHDHPDLRRGNQLLVSYNVNSLDANTDLYADVSIYRPRFVVRHPGGSAMSTSGGVVRRSLLDDLATSMLALIARPQAVVR